MNQAEFHIRTEHDGVLTLQQAVLIYRGAQGSAFATVHDVEDIDGEATILAGKAMTPPAALTLSRELAQAGGEGEHMPELQPWEKGVWPLLWEKKKKRHL